MTAAEKIKLQWGHGREAMDGELPKYLSGLAKPLQWGHGREAMDGSGAPSCPRHKRRFNGAMAVRPWMAVRQVDESDVWQPLQWGHGREAMDGQCLPRPLPAVRPASMGPWP